MSSDSPTADRREIRRTATSAQILGRFGVARGVPLDVCLAGTGLEPDTLEDPAAEISPTQELALVQNLVGALGDRAPGSGIEAGTHYHLTTYGIWGFAVLSCPTLRSALDLALRYADLTFGFARIALEVSGDEARLVLDDSGIPPPLRAFLVERDAAAIATSQRELISVAPPLRRVSFRHAAPPNLAPYEAVFATTPRFGEEANVIAFDAAFLEAPLPQANEHTAQVCEAQCRDLLARRRARTGLAERVRDKLLERPAQMPDMEAMARALAMTSRTLRRRLEAEGTKYRDLVDEVRITVAEELLTLDAITLDEISDRVGYSELASFLHAFKRITGTTPTAFRKARASRP